MVWPIGKTLSNGTYLIKEVLGQGGFGVTYRVFDNELKIDMVVKIPNDELQADPEFPKFVQRFRREAEILAKLKQVGHPHVVGINRLFTENDIPCLLMDFVEGVSLWDLVRDIGVLTPKEATIYMRQIASALIEVHRLQTVHRDAHPGNIMIPRRNFAKLIDFGIAGEVLPSQKMSSKIFGHPQFAAPEQWRGSKRPTVDIFTLSASLYYALTAKAPEFDENDQLVLLPQSVNPRVSNQLQALIIQSLNIDWKLRPQSMKEWLEQLESTMPAEPRKFFPVLTSPTRQVVLPLVSNEPEMLGILSQSAVTDNEREFVTHTINSHGLPSGIEVQSPALFQQTKWSFSKIFRVHLPWRIFCLPFLISIATGYFWQTVDVRHGMSLSLYLLSEIFREQQSPLNWTIMDFVAPIVLSSFIAGLSLGGSGYLGLRFLFPKSNEMLIVLGFITSIFAFAWVGTLAGATVATLVLALAEHQLQLLRRYSTRQYMLLLIGFWGTGVGFGWLIYRLFTPAFNFGLPSGF